MALPAVLAAALVAASVAFAARGASPARDLTLRQATARTSSAPSLRFELAVRIETAGSEPQTLRARGVAGGAVQQVHVKVDDVVAPDGTTLTGPSADEKVDGHFLYLRSTTTRALVGPLWVRERLSSLGTRSAELRTLRSVSPTTLLAAVSRARAAREGPEARVFHAWLPYRDATVRSALARVEGEREYRGLRLTAWTNPDGLVRMVLLTGRTPDGRSTFLLTLWLRDFGRPVAVTPPRESRLFDPELSRLEA